MRKTVLNITTARLFLRPYKMEDLDALHKLLVEPSVRKYLLDGQIMPREWVEEEIRNTIALFKSDGFGQFAMFLKGEQMLIGLCGYRYFYEPPELQLLYGLASSQWGKGFAAEAARAMIRFGFDEHGFERIIANTDVPNTASIRVLEKVGMKFDKQTMINEIDTLCYSISRDEFHWDDSEYRLTYL